jgi:hypothetical protein
MRASLLLHGYSVSGAIEELYLCAPEASSDEDE